MKIVRVLITASILLFVVTVSWYISQPVVIGFARSLRPMISIQAGLNIATAIEYVSFAWGPLLDGFILLWAAISASERDVESQIYG